MHPESVRPATRNCLALLTQTSWLSDFYLAGGTGLALHLGHRFSEDLDFFSPKEVDPKKLRFALSSLGKLKVEMEREGTLWATLEGTKISFFHYPYALMEEVKTFENVCIANIKDIASMKLDTISRRGGRKDFIDLYFILKQGHPLSEILGWFQKKYSEVAYNQVHLLKSLVYFEDAEKDVMPTMIQQCEWRKIKNLLIAESKKAVFA